MDRAKSILEGKVPYRDFRDIHPPLWSYTLAFWFKLIGREPSVDGVKAFIFIFSMLNILAIYVITRRIFSQHEAIIAALFLAINPLDIINSISWGHFDAVPIFFVLLSFYFLQRDKWRNSALFLGVAIMFKYIAALVFVPFLIHIWKKTRIEQPSFLQEILSNKPVMHYLYTVIGFCFIVTLPFWILDARSFARYGLTFALEARPRVTVSGFFAHLFSHYYPESVGSVSKDKYWKNYDLTIVHQLGAVEYFLKISVLLLVTKKFLSKKDKLKEIEFVFLAFLWTLLFTALSMTALPQYFMYSMPWLAILVAWYSTQYGMINPRKSFSLRLFIASWLIPLTLILAQLTYKNYFGLSPISIYYLGYALGVAAFNIPLYYALIKYYYLLH
ncbi:MAG: glycosyltransferase family 39 protein [Candidatus Hodarchaeota archaeon]